MPFFFWPLVLAAGWSECKIQVMTSQWIGYRKLWLMIIFPMSLIGLSLGVAALHAWSIPALAWRQPIESCLSRLLPVSDRNAGLADYWLARPMTLSSNFRLQVQPINNEGQPSLWGNDPYWFTHSITSPSQVPTYSFIVMAQLSPTAIAARFEWPRLMEILSTTFAIIMAWCLIMVAAFNHVGIMTGEFVGAWRGVFAEKNSLGGYMAIGFLSCSSAGLLNPKRRIMWLLFASLAAFLVLKSTSKTSLLALIIGMGMMGLVIARRGPIKAVIVAWASLIVLVLSTFILVADPIILLKILGRDATLTGRTIIWKAIERVSMEKPDFGYGYGAVWTTRGIWSPYYKIGIYSGFHPQTAHSAWYEIKLGLGLWGLVMWVLILIQAWLTGLWRSFRDGGGYFALPFLAIYGLMSISESIALGYNELRWMIFTSMP